MINKIEKIEDWLKKLDLEQLDESELYLIPHPLNVDDNQVCEIFKILEKIIDMRYAQSSWRPNYDVLELPCEVKKTEYKQRYVLGVFCK